MTRLGAYGKGAFTRVREEVTAIDLQVTGVIPNDLDGRYLRNGPNPVGVEHAQFHYYLGAGMIHGVRLRSGRAEWYRNRWVRQSAVSSALKEKPPAYLVLGGMDGASNTNVIGHGGRILSLVEGGTLPFEVGGDLNTIGAHDFDGGLRSGISAHPKLDPSTGDLHTLGYFAGSQVADYNVISAAGQVVRSEPIDLPNRPMMHDFALTPRYIVVLDLPAVFSPLAAATRDPFPFRWNAKSKARLGLMPRDGAAKNITWFEIEPVWIYHTVNAFDLPNGVVMDVITHPSMFAKGRGLIEGHGMPSLERFTIDLVKGRVERARLDATPQEFPRIDERRVGLPHRFVYTASAPDLVQSWSAGPEDFAQLDDSRFDNIVYKHDLDQARSTGRRFGRDAAVGEAIFVPRREGTTVEDDGYLLCYVHDPDRGSSDLVILSAQDFEGPELARVHIPVRVPLGLHGSWIPAGVGDE
ncbi:carotenoid oxygenase family protein [Cryobacterium sp. TMS1-13-1]|uniref:carotenoid oxygenase family protein n=1 Tax=Cryobacterium sp. TMS1-13-1 TaxID=1259220 RepID=UPI00106A6FB5|nr:carotenoid oxygenase family protein [Cryobacterium sp. TMS1-13-1]TFD19185.1 carotenoid oxygenase [Cryobacterium sp. TMS1-13-1]